MLNIKCVLRELETESILNSTKISDYLIVMKPDCAGNVYFFTEYLS